MEASGRWPGVLARGKASGLCPGCGLRSGSHRPRVGAGRGPPGGGAEPAQGALRRRQGARAACSAQEGGRSSETPPSSPVLSLSTSM